MAQAARDQREIITPDAFSVAPELLGIPLARPWRRGVAMGIDLFLIAVLSQAGWLVLGLGVAVLFFRLALRRSRGPLRKSARVALFGSLGTATAAVTLWASGCFSGLPSPGELGEGVVTSGLGIDQPAVRAVTGVLGDYRALQQAETEDEAREAARELSERMRTLGMNSQDIRSFLDSLAVARGEPWAPGAVRAGYQSVLGGSPAESSLPENPDSLVVAYTEALRDGDSSRVVAIRDRLGATLAAERLSDQRGRIEALEKERDRLQAEAAEEGGLINLILKVANEIGIEFGWSALYFTLFPLFWSGRTPGKRLLRIRVVRLDAKPLGWWSALNRFGGYAASIFTGLLGFFEMFWDDNRQALQDRIASTVVILEPKGTGKKFAPVTGR
ncbi:MAG: RDD family protein [Gemmatimonadota bacterium]|nr:MAG: RDD family protein [Gemmatimonadota bacterium]